MHDPLKLDPRIAERLRAMSRREMLQRTGAGVGSMALGSLLSRDLRAASTQPSHFEPRAKRVIYMHMVGAPSHLDLFEHKPELVKHSGKPCPDHLLTEGQQFAFIRGHPKLLGSPFKFKPCGQSGLMISELLPHLQQVADEITVLKSLHTEEINHGPAQLFQMTGFGRHGRPSLGSWVNYGLGSENDNLPSFVVMNTGAVAGGGSALWGSGFLPGKYQGIEFRSSGDPVLFLSNPKGLSNGDRRRIVDSINTLNRVELADVGDPEIATRITQYEMAYRMQASVPELMDISDEPKWVHEMYGTKPGKSSFANNCLLARRLVERGVRFVQLYDADWDHHGGLQKSLPNKCKQVDQPMSALIRDLKMRGLLDETLVVWGGEFGRTPVLQGAAGGKGGRDHHKDAYCAWMAGGGVKHGFSYGQTDEIGFHITENPMHVNDFHATLLHLLGLDHERLTFRFQGRDYRLTDIAGKVAYPVLT